MDLRTTAMQLVFMIGRYNGPVCLCVCVLLILYNENGDKEIEEAENSAKFKMNNRFVWTVFHFDFEEMKNHTIAKCCVIALTKRLYRVIK